MRRQISPTAKRQFDWIHDTYSIGNNVDTWAREIVAKANKQKRPINEVTLQSVLELLDPENAIKLQSDLEISLERFREGEWFAKAKLIATAIAQRSPPVKVRVSQKVFQGFCDHSLSIEVMTIYEINLALKQVIFRAFYSYTPSSHTNPLPTQDASDWT